MGETAGLQDGEMRKQFQRTLTKQGFKFKLSTKVVSGEVTGDTVKLELEAAKGGNKETLEADVVLVSAGAPPFPLPPSSPTYPHTYRSHLHHLGSPCAHAPAYSTASVLTRKPLPNQDWFCAA